MTYFDVVRFLVFALFGIGLGFMLVTNSLVFVLLRPARAYSFLWWHVTSISLSFVCIGIVATERVVSRVGEPPGWRSAVTLLGMALFVVAQVIIFHVERRRYAHFRAVGVVGDVTDAAVPSPPGTLPEP